MVVGLWAGGDCRFDDDWDGRVDFLDTRRRVVRLSYFVSVCDHLGAEMGTGDRLGAAHRFDGGASLRADAVATRATRLVALYAVFDGGNLDAGLG